MSSQNPKDIAARGRVPLELLPAAGRIQGALACRDGAAKYGEYNWRVEPISLMGYTGAMERHLLALRDGEDLASDSGLHHLAHVIATASIVLDAMACGTLIDDRPKPGPAAKMLREQQGRDWDAEIVEKMTWRDCPFLDNPGPGAPVVNCTLKDGHEGQHRGHRIDGSRHEWM